MDMKESRNPGSWGRDIRQNPKGHLKVKLLRYQSLSISGESFPGNPGNLGEWYWVRGWEDSNGFSSLSNMSGWHRRTLFVPVTAAKRSGPSALTRHMERARCVAWHQSYCAAMRMLREWFVACEVTSSVRITTVVILTVPWQVCFVLV